MSRDLSTGIAAALDDDVVYPCFAVELLFDGDNVLRLWTGYGVLNYDSVDWYGTGNLLDISSVEETTEISAKGASLVLSGVPSELISLALSEPYQGRLCKIYFGMFSSGNTLIGNDLTEVFVGYMDQMNIEEGPDTSVIELKVENKLIDLERPRVARYTNSYQQSIYPDDRGFEFVEDLQDKEIYWGRKAPK